VAVLTPNRLATYREAPLHAQLKAWYARPGDRIEAPVDGYQVDLVRGEQLIEIQTRGFAGMRPKLEALLARGHAIRIVHPVAVDRWIVNLDPDGRPLTRRRSPRHGGAVDVAIELVSFPELLAHPGLELEVVLTRDEELRRHEAGRCWRRKGWVVVEHRLVDVVDRILLAGPADLVRLLPVGLPELFTTADVALGLRRPQAIAERLAYCLRRAGCVEVVGRRGRFVEYRLAAVVAGPA
jgi:hypothetical protein